MSVQPPPGLKPSTRWPGFLIGPDPDRITLSQISETQFVLQSTLWYTGELGVTPKNSDVEEALRSVSPAVLGPTDLASVPAPFRWWINTYGVHTPAALIHDRFIGDPAQMKQLSGLTEQDVDRCFRFMLGTLGVSKPRRWLIWAAVAVRTRLMSGMRRRIQMILWFALAVLGLFLTFRASQGAVSWWWPILLPIPSAALWGHQWGAGIAIAYIGVPTLGIPAVVAALGIVWSKALGAMSALFSRDT
ncbi:MAG: DUF1353 domain-containing protein [Actinomycetota bacterium]